MVETMVESNYSLALQGQGVDAPRPGLLVRTAYRVYKNRFSTWFAIMAPTSLIAAGILTLADYRIRQIYKSIPRGDFLLHPGVIVIPLIWRFGSYFLSWLLGCFALGAIGTEVSADGGEEEESSAWKHDAHQRTRERFGQVFLLALVTFGALLAGLALVEVVQFAAIRVIGWQRLRPYSYVVALVSTVVVASIVSWLGTAFPLSISGRMGVWAALKSSIELSSVYEGALVLLVVHSVAGPYISWLVIHYIARILLPLSFLYTALGY
jgi:hypothetical protein